MNSWIPLTIYIVYDNSTVPTSELFDFEYYTAFKLLSHSISSRIDLTFQTYIFPHREHSFLPKHAVFQLRGWLQGRGDRVLRGVHVGPWEILETRSVALSFYSLSLFLVAFHLFVPVVKFSGARLFRFSAWAPTYVVSLARVADGLTAQMHLHSPPTSYQSLIKPLWIVLQEKKVWIWWI